MSNSRYRQNREKRNNKNNDYADQQSKNPEVDESSEVTKVFRQFQKELDLKNDRHERLVKLSRDITIESKRIIFFLHRVTGSDNRSEILKEADAKLQELHQTKFLPLANELKGQDPYQFLRAYSPGLQEYIEAVTFYHYLKDQKLVGVEKIQTEIYSSFKNMSKESSSTEPTTTTTTTASVPVTVESVEKPTGSASTSTTEDSPTSAEVPMPVTEYMLGIADFTGELMRMAINCVGAGDLDTPKEVTDLMRVIHNAFASFNNMPRELRRKATVLRQSLHKVENACYNLRVRGSEIPKHMLADVFSTAHSTIPDDNFTGETED